MDVPLMRRVVLALGLGALVLGGSDPVSAQTRGNTETITSDLTFEASGQSMWTRGTSYSPFSFGVPLFDVSTGQASDTKSASAGIPHIGEVSLNVNLTADLGLSAGLGLELADGSVGVTYPARVQVTVPERNSFRRGEPVVIGTGYSLRPGGALTSQPAAVTATLSAGADLYFSAGAGACMSNVGCGNFTLPSLDIEPYIDILRINSNGTVTVPWIPGLSIDALRHEFTQIEEELWDIKEYDDETGRGFIDRVMVPVSSSVAGDGLSLIGEKDHRFLSIALDLDARLCQHPLNPCLGEVEQSLDVAGFKLAWAEWEIADLAENFDLNHNQRFEFFPDPKVRLVFPESVAWRELAPGGSVVASGTSSSVWVTVGNALEVTFPEHRTAAMDGLPARVRMDNTFTSHSRLLYQRSISAKAGVKLDAGTYSKTFFGISYPCGTKSTPPFIKFCSTNVTAPALDIPAIGPLITRHWNLENAWADVFPLKSWQLDGFEELNGNAYFLDPERPVISVATSLENTALLDGSVPGSVTQTLRVRNPGDVALSDTQIRDLVTMEAGVGGFEVLEVRAPTDPRLTPDAAFDGTGFADVLSGADRISADSADVLTWTVETVIALQPGDVYHWSVLASGVSPIGTPVDDETAISLAIYEFDIIPQRLQAVTPGELPTSIRSTEHLDARRIDPRSVTLEGIPPTRWEWVTRAGGLVDLDLKFDRALVATALLARLDDQGAPLPVTVEPPSSPLSPEGVARALFRGGDENLATAADERGNRNGRLDVGDLRALLLRTDADGGTAGAPGDDRGTAHADGTTLVARGTLEDGTTFYAEDDVVVVRRQP